MRFPWRSVAGLAALTIFGPVTLTATPAHGVNPIAARPCITADGPAVEVSFAAAGVRERLCFRAGAAEHFDLVVRTESSQADFEQRFWLTVSAPAGTGVPTETDTSHNYLTAHFVAPVTGEHSIEMGRITADAETVTLQLVRTRTATVRPDGPPAQLTLDHPGVRGIAAFDASAGQRLTVITRIRPIILDLPVTYKIFAPDGASVREGLLFWRSGDRYDGSIDIVAPAAGRYTFAVDLSELETIVLTVNLIGGRPGTLTLGGPATAVTITRPGENAYLTFPAVAGEHLTIDTALGTLPNVLGVNLDVTAPDGTVVVADWIGDNVKDNKHGSVDFIAPLTGAYTFALNPKALDIGTAAVTLKKSP